MPAAALTPREVAELSGTPKHVVEKAIEERVLPVRAAARRSGRSGRLLPTHAVVYAAVVTRLELKLTALHKRRLFGMLSRLKPRDVSRARVELAPAVMIDVGRLAGDVLDRAENYRLARDAWIRVDSKIMGGMPVLRGTRMTVYSILGRIEHGESVEDILSDNPDLTRQSIDAAITYARAHPVVGRPIGRRAKRREAFH